MDAQTMTERADEDWMIKPAERFCHRAGYDVQRGAPVCYWKNCPRNVGMDCYLLVRADGESEGRNDR